MLMAVAVAGRLLLWFGVVAHSFMAGSAWNRRTV
jgi:hypothetical protein